MPKPSLEQYFNHVNLKRRQRRRCLSHLGYSSQDSSSLLSCPPPKREHEARAARALPLVPSLHIVDGLDGLRKCRQAIKEEMN